MIRHILLAGLLLLIGPQAFSQKVQFISVEHIHQMVERNSDSLFVVNFWATWCKPCIREMPHFKEVKESLAGEKVQFYFVSLNSNEAQVLSFMKKHGYSNDMYWLTDDDANEFIPAISDEWEGAIPATLFIQPASGYYDLFEQEFSKEALLSQIKKYKL